MTPAHRLSDQLDSLRRKLDNLDDSLLSRLQEPLPRDLGQVEAAVMAHKEFEHHLQSHEPDVLSVQDAYQHLSPVRRTQQVENKLSGVIDKWDHLGALTNTYVER